jgi:hypothetical protein
MRPVVALVEATPDTILDDYRRVLELAGLGEIAGTGPVALVPQSAPGGWVPGAGSPPWQLDGTLSWLEGVRGPGLAEQRGRTGHSILAVPISPRGDAVAGEGWGWGEVLARHGVGLAGPEFRMTRTFRADPPLPSLEAMSPKGLQVPVGLAGRSVLLLPVPALDAAWPVAGAVALLRGLLAPRLHRPGRLSAAEVLADLVGFARQAIGSLGVVTDAVIWDIRGAGLSRRPVNRNILLAGTDPVAVDAVSSRLAGQDPDRVPWLRLCRERGLGPSRIEDIRIAGRKDLLKLDFGVPGLTFGGGSALGRPQRMFDRAWRILRKPAILKQHARTPWGRLYAEYRDRTVQGASS